MMYTSEDNIIHGETVFFLDDGGSTTPAKGEKPHFSGIILVQDLAGTTKHGFISYPDGSVCAIRPSTAQEEPTVKSLICFTFETWQKGSLDRGDTWSNYILLSSYTSCFETFEPAIMTMLNPDDYAMGGGGGSGGNMGGSDDPDESLDTSQPGDPCYNANLIEGYQDHWSLDQYIEELLDAAFDLNYEVGYTVDYRGRYTRYQGPPEECFTTFSNSTYLRMFIHSHPEQCGLIYSFGDIKMIYNLNKQGAIELQGFQLGLVNYLGDVYFMSVSDVERFNTYTANWDDETNYANQNDAFLIAYQKIRDMSKQKQESFLLEYLNSAGITLLKQSGSGWSSLSLDSNNKPILSNPCNN